MAQLTGVFRVRLLAQSARFFWLPFMSAFSRLDDLIQRIAALIAATPAADVEKNLRSLLVSSLARLDLVPREEFELQRAMLQRALVRQATLEERLAVLEARAAPAPAEHGPDTQATA